MATVGLLEYWYAALRSQSGVCVPFEGDAALAKAQLYKARKDALDANLDSISIADSPTASNELWLVHNGKQTSGT
jgi:hypothetical protein